MNNLMSYCGLVDARIKASDKDLPVSCSLSIRQEIYKGALGTIAVPIWPWGIISKPNNKFVFWSRFHQSAFIVVRILELCTMLQLPGLPHWPERMCLWIKFFSTLLIFLHVSSSKMKVFVAFFKVFSRYCCPRV